MERWQQIEEIFHEALQRDPAQRDGYLRQACGRDAALRGEIAGLLAHHEQSAGFEPWAAAAAAQLIDAPASLQPSQSLGPYRIESFIAAGGMGEVYRATDTRLNREVAIKVCGERFSDRFEREARLVASMNHPNICQLYDVGPNYLVMELVVGPTLADRINQSALPLQESLPIARQIAEGLEAAHEKGRIHRDLKPANIKITPEGVVKLLDFGLAKAAEETATPGDPAGSPTVTISATRPGIILGTASYMSPEQAAGKPVDKRSDIWSFGVVLYEMLTGQRAYEAGDMSGTLAAVLTRDVDWKALPADVPPRLLALLRDCLVRDPKQRLRDIGDARRVLDQIIAGVPEPAAGIPSVQSQTRPSSARALPWGVAAVALAGAAALAFVHSRETPPTQQRIRFHVRAPEKSLIAAFALSPDGRYLAFATGDPFTGMQGATSKLWLRPIDSIDARAVPGTEGTSVLPDQFFWSPDSEFIGFVTQNGKLKKVSVNGGPPQTLSDVTPITRGAWGKDGIILLVRSPGLPIQRVPAIGGALVDVTKKSDGQSWSQPQFLPDGRHFLCYVTGVNAEANGIYVASLEDDKQGRRLLPDSTVARYVPSGVPGRSGYLLFVRERTLMAQPFDADTVTLKGQMFQVAEPVGGFSVSQNGALVYTGGSPMFRQELLWVERSGRQLGVVAAAAQYRSVRLSPDEKSIAFDRNEGGNSDVWALDLVRGVPSRITSDPMPDRLPIWSPDGRRILWSRRSGNSDTMDLYINAANGTGRDEKLITMGSTYGSASDWSRDSKFVLYTRPGDMTGQDLWMAPQSTGASSEPQKPFPYLASPFNEGYGVFSPDGHWIAYESDESGRPEVYVQSFPLTNQKVRISTGGGTDAAWSNNGELFYLAADRNLMAVPYRATGTAFEPGAGKVLFTVPGNVVHRSYAVGGDGRRFLVGKPLNESIGEPITWVLNWLDEPKQRVSSK